jgi:hypothetical protein
MYQFQYSRASYAAFVERVATVLDSHTAPRHYGYKRR